MSPSPPSPEAAEIGRQLRILITNSGRRMKDIAAAVDMQPAQLSRIARGTGGDLKITTVARVAAELGMELRLVSINGQEEVSGGDHRAA